MKRLNVRLIVCLVVGALVVAVVVHFVHAWQVNRNADGLLRRAELAEEKGQLEESASLLSRYLKHRPDDVATYSRLAFLLDEISQQPHADRDDFFAALHTLEKAVRQNPDNVELRHRVVKFYTRVRRSKDAIEHLQYLMEEAGEQENAQLQLLLAKSLLSGADFKQAAAVLRRIVGYSPQEDAFDPDRALNASDIEAYDLLARLERQSFSNPQLADRIMQQAVEANDALHEAYLSRGKYLLAHHRSDEEKLKQGRSDIRKALELAPDNAEVLRAAAEVELAEEQYDRAEALLDRGLREFPDNEHFYRLRAALALANGDRQAALRFTEQGLRRLPNSWSLVLFRVDLDLADRNFDAVRQAIEHLRAHNEMRFLGDYVEARMLVLQSKWLPSRDKLDAVLPELVARRSDLAPQGYLLLAQCCEQLAQWDRQLDACRQALRLRPGSMAARWSEVRAIAALGRVEEARRRFDTLKRVAQQRGVELPGLAEWEHSLLLAEQRHKPAERRDWQQIDEQFQQRLADREDLSEAQKAAMHVRFLMQKDMLDAAARRLEAALAQFPRDETLLLLDVDLLRRRQSPAAALARLDEVQEQIGDSAQLRVRRANLFAAGEEKGIANELRKLEHGAALFDKDDCVRLWQGLGAVHYSLGRYGEAGRLWRQVADARPDDLTVRLQLFELAHAADDDQAMAKAAAEIKSLAGENSATWKFVEASRLMLSIGQSQADEQTLQKVRSLIQDARLQRPSWHVLSLLEADLSLLDGEVDSAIEHLQAALEQGPPKSDVMRKLADLLMSRQRFDEARDVMQRIGGQGDSVADQRLLAQAEAAAGNFQQAAKFAGKVAEETGRAEDQIWLGRLLVRAGRDEQAIEAYERAAVLAPQSETAAILLVQQLVKVGRQEEAESTIRRLALQLPADRAPGVLGRAYQLLGQLRQAHHYFEQALLARPNDPRALRDAATLQLVLNNSSQASGYLDRLLAQDAKRQNGAQRHQAWARRTKARLLATGGSYSEFQRAMKLIAANARDDGTLSPEDLSLTATLSAARPEPKTKQNAIALLEQSRKKRSLTAEESLVLAELYEATSQWPQCEEVMTTLLADAEHNPDVVLTWCEMKLRRDDLTNIEPLLRNVQENSARRIQIRAQMLVKGGQHQQAVELIDSIFSSSGAARPESDLGRARFFEQIELFDEAERALREYVAETPRQELLLAEFLGRRGRLEEALAICERHLQGTSIIAATQIAVSGLTSHQHMLTPDSPHFARVDSWLATGTRRFPDSKSLQLNRAFFEALRGNHEVVEAQYRRLLARRDLRFNERAVVQNNLAVIAAVQGRCHEAQSLVEEAIRQLGPAAELLDTRALVALCRADEQSVAVAIEDLKSALTVLDEPMIRFHLARAYSHAGEMDAARQQFDRSRGQGLTLAKVPLLERPSYRQLARRLGVATASAGPSQ